MLVLVLVLVHEHEHERVDQSFVWGSLTPLLQARANVVRAADLRTNPFCAFCVLCGFRAQTEPHRCVVRAAILAAKDAWGDSRIAPPSATIHGRDGNLVPW